ncbi:Sister chromatid cohesion protein DCC1 [Linum perenne]
MAQPHSFFTGADAVLNLQPNSSLSVAYDTLFGSGHNLMLLELHDNMLPDLLHQRVTLRGEPDEDTVLCTQSKTYAVKFVGTSNSVFLIPPSGQFSQTSGLHDCDAKAYDQQPVASVFEISAGTMEIVEIAPKLDRLKTLLVQKPYCSMDQVQADNMEDDSKENQMGLYRWGDLVDKIQASDEELRSGLQALSAVEIDGFWRIVDEKYMDTVLKMLLHNSVLNDWSLDALLENEVVACLVTDGFPQRIAYHCLDVYGNMVDRSEGKSYVWKLDERRVCVHFARQLLGVGKMKLESFMEKWSKKIPDGMHLSFDMLEGEVLTEKVGMETWVRGFRVSCLPSNPAERFTILFRERPKWEWKDLQPYIRDLKVPGLSSEGLLLKFTRRIQPTQEQEPVFSAR